MAYIKNKTIKWATKQSIKDALKEKGFDIKNKDINKSVSGKCWNITSGKKLFSLNLTNGNIESLVVWCKTNF